MTRILGIEIATKYESAATKIAIGDLREFSIASDKARGSAERLAAQASRLKILAQANTELAASAAKGSEEQLIYAHAADKATAALARMGIEANAAAGKVARSAGETRLAERELGKFTRGAAEASGKFGRLGFGLALGSGGFLAGAAATGGVKVAIDAARELADAREQLAVAARNVGVSLNEKQLDDYLTAESKLSLFTKTELTSSLIGLVRATGSVTKAQEDASLAANIARATHKDLADVTQGLINLEGGRTRSLVALGVKIPVVKTATDALTASGLKFTGQQRAEAAALDRAATAAEGKRILMERYHGSAEKYAKSDAAAQDKLRVAENLLATSIGTVLLPVVKTIADPFAKWAEKEAQSGDAARKTKEIVGDLTTVLGDAKTVVKGVDYVTGGFRHTLELLIGLKFAAVIAGWTREMKLFGAASATAGAEAAGGAKGGGILGLIRALGPAAALGGGALLAGSLTGGDKPGKTTVDPTTGEYVIKLSGGQVWHTGTYAKGFKVSGGIVGPPVAGGGASGSKLRALIAASARAHGVDPTAALAVAAAEGGFSGAVGDGGHAFGPFQINNAGGVATGMSGSFLKGFANTPVGIDFAMKKIAAVAAGKSGYDAIRAIITGFERPADGGAGDLRRATAFLMGGGVTSMAGLQNGGNSAAIAAILAKGTKKPVTLHGSSLISSALLDKIASDKNNATDSTGSVAAMWLHRELADLKKARDEVAAKLKGASPKQKTAIDTELRSLDTQIAGVNKAITTNLKAQAQAIKTNAAAAITAAKQGIASAFSQIISDAQSAFSKETQDYIDSVIGPKFFQGTDAHGMQLQTPKEKQLADMQAADTAQGLQDALDAAKKQLADDTKGALIEHIVDIATGASKDIFGPAGTPEQRALDQKAIDAAQRAIDENQVAIDAAKERAQEDYDYAQEVKRYQQERSLAESAMVHSLNELEKGVENGTASFTDIQGVLLKFGVSVSDIPTDQWSTDWANLSSATQALAKVMLDEAAALARIGDGKDAAAVAAAAASINWQAPVAPGQVSVTAGLGGSAGYFMLNPIPKAAKGADVLRDGLIYAHKGEKVQPADVAAYSGGGGGIHVTVVAPNYVGTHDDLARAIKSPQMVETISTAVLMGNRRGHIRASQLN